MADRMTVTEDGKINQREAVEKLREWLLSQGFSTSSNPMAGEHNDCRWYAWRRSSIPARRCECNDDKEGVQIVVTPTLYAIRDRQFASVEVDVAGQYGGPWFKLHAYSIGVDELPEKLPSIEAALVRAWNALASAGVQGTFNDQPKENGNG